MEKLPKTWYVTVTKENQKILTEWRFSTTTFELPIGGVTGMYVGGTKEWDWKHSKSSKWENEITFGQFKKWVLGHVEPEYEIY